MASSGPIVLSYQNTLLRESDFQLLDEPNWLNDNLIAFYFEYLENEIYSKYQDQVAFLAPQVVQFIRSAIQSGANVSQDVACMLGDEEIQNKKLFLLPINDCSSFKSGGTHWSLLVVNCADKQNIVFEHYDSRKGSSNRSCAVKVATILSIALSKSTSIPVVKETDCVQQNNFYDCGIHLICNARAVCRKILDQEQTSIMEMANEKTVQQMRSELRKLILKLKQKNDETVE